MSSTTTKRRKRAAVAAGGVTALAVGAAVASRGRVKPTEVRSATLALRSASSSGALVKAARAGKRANTARVMFKSKPTPYRGKRIYKRDALGRFAKG